MPIIPGEAGVLATGNVAGNSSIVVVGNSKYGSGRRGSSGNFCENQAGTGFGEENFITAAGVGTSGDSVCLK